MKSRTPFFSNGNSENHSFSQERDRSKIPDRYTWDLAAIYDSDLSWKAGKARLVTELPAIDQYRGRLAESPATLLACLELVNRLSKEYARLSCYASMRSDEDTRNAGALAMEQEMSQIGADFGARCSFLEPEIQKSSWAMIESFIAREQRLQPYRHSLQDSFRRKAHTGTEPEEKIIADAGLMADGPGAIYGIFSNAEFPFPEVTMTDGRSVRLDKAAFSLHRSAPDREDRRKVFAAYFGALNDYRRTFGTQLYAEVKKNMFFARARKYRSCLERALDGSNIPEAVYRGLIDNVHAHLSTFHRYLNLRKRMMEIEQLHYYDLYAPLVKQVDLEYSYDQATELVLESLQPLGDAYIAVARRAFEERWLDVFPTEGKRAGAYSNGGVYDVHPYMLLNYNGKYDDVSTLTHELGHTMHSWLSNTHQPYVNSQYSIFVAEVASTFNEALLMDYMLRTITEEDVRLSLLGNYLDGIRGTVFRQTQFSEFELKIHETAEGGESLTGDALSELYAESARRYYGHDRQICVVDDDIRVEWANVPHFYYNFYVYQYATSFTASSALSEQVLAGDRDTLKRYLNLLAAGGSDYPIALLRNAGVDMTTPAPFEMTMQKMNRVMDEMERILEGRRAAKETV